MCDELATSHEHVPPKCIFPERKDMEGEDFRNQLITVPSCDKHNGKKSKDDEFLMVSLAGILGNNSIGYKHKLTKVNRAIKNSSGRLLEAAFSKRKHFLVKLEDNAFLEVIWGTPARDRLITCFNHIAQGIYFHHFADKFKGRINIFMGYLNNGDKNSATFTTFIRHKADIELKDQERFGHNQRVFYYQFTQPDQFGVFMLKMCFYEGVDIYVSFIPKNVEVPSNLGMMLMEKGIKTIITLEDKSYEFN